MKRKAKFLFYHPEKEEILILLGKRQDPSGEEFWWLPGGSAETGEGLFEAAVRELNEELNVPKVIDASVSKYTETKPPAFIRYSTEQSEVTVFLVLSPIKEGSISCKEEFIEMHWFPLSHLPSNLSREFSNIKPYLSFSFLGSLCT